MVNVKIDYGRLNRLNFNQENRKVLENIITDEQVTSDLVTKISFDQMYDSKYFENKLKEEFQLKIETEELRKAIEVMAYEGEVEHYLNYISEHVLKTLSNRDLVKFDEKYVKVILLSFLELKYLKKGDEGLLDRVKEKGI